MADEVETVVITANAWERSIGGRVPNIVIEERSFDELQITQHPVEQGAAITDHAYKLPAVVDIRAGWSNSSEQAAGDEAYVLEVYEDLLALQEGRELIEVNTGKRRYTNMLIASIGTITDERTETTLAVTFSLRQVIVVETQVTTVPPSDVHEDPSRTAPTGSGGTKQLQSAPNFNAAQ